MPISCAPSRSIRHRRKSSSRWPDGPTVLFCPDARWHPPALRADPLRPEGGVRSTACRACLPLRDEGGVRSTACRACLPPSGRRGCSKYGVPCLSSPFGTKGDRGGWPFVVPDGDVYSDF